MRKSPFFLLVLAFYSLGTASYGAINWRSWLSAVPGGVQCGLTAAWSLVCLDSTIRGTPRAVPRFKPSVETLLRQLALWREGKTSRSDGELIHWARWIYEYEQELSVRSAFLETILANRYLANQGAQMIGQGTGHFLGLESQVAEALDGPLVDGRLSERHTNAALILVHSGDRTTVFPERIKRIYEKRSKDREITASDAYLLVETAFSLMREKLKKGRHQFVRLDSNSAGAFDPELIAQLKELAAAMVSGTQLRGLGSILSAYLRVLELPAETIQIPLMKISDEWAQSMLRVSTSASEWIQVHASIGLLIAANPEISAQFFVRTLMDPKASSRRRQLAFANLVDMVGMFAATGQLARLTPHFVRIPIATIRALPDAVNSIHMAPTDFPGAGSVVGNVHRMDMLFRHIDQMVPGLSLSSTRDSDG